MLFFKNKKQMKPLKSKNIKRILHRPLQVTDTAFLCGYSLYYILRI